MPETPKPDPAPLPQQSPADTDRAGDDTSGAPQRRPDQLHPVDRPNEAEEQADQQGGDTGATS
jgi:hypothetical protein